MIAAPVQCDVDGVPKGSHFCKSTADWVHRAIDAADHGRSRIGGQATTCSGVQAIDREVTHAVSRTATLSP